MQLKAALITHRADIKLYGATTIIDGACPRPQDVLVHIAEAVKAGILVGKLCQLVIMRLRPYST